MRIVASNSSSMLFWSSLCIGTSTNGVAEAFLSVPHRIARIAPSRTFVKPPTTALAFHPQTVEDSDNHNNYFHSPAESFTFTRYAKTSTISSEYVQSEWKDDDNSQRLSYLDVISSTASVDPKQDSSRDSDTTPPPEEPLAQAHRIQQAYREWCEFYGKIPGKERLGVFAENYLTVEDFHAKTGRPLVLNEFADMTEEEYLRDKEQPPSSSSSGSDETETATTTTKTTTTEPFQDDEDTGRIREAYRQWCDYYGRSFDEKRLKTFASNFVAVEKYHLQTKQSLVLNEFADMTEEQYRTHLATAAHFTTPENIGPRANEDSTTPAVSLPEKRDTIQPAANDPITSYLDPEPSSSPITTQYSSPPQVVEDLKPPIPKSQTEIIVQSSSNDPDVSRGTSSLERATSEYSASSNEVLATLQNTVASLTKMVQSLAERPPPPPAPEPPAPQPAQPLDSLVIDVLQQQDESIFQLEGSVEGLHEIQMQSSELIEMVSNNQKKMTEMMEAVQLEVAALRQEQDETQDNYALLLSRIEDLEAVVAKFDGDDPVLARSLVLSPGSATQPRRIELKPNLPPIGYEQPQIQP